jgi:hypothetical protein
MRHCWCFRSSASRTPTRPGYPAPSTPSGSTFPLAARCCIAIHRAATAWQGNEGAFLPCSFWLVQALAHTGRRVEAVDLFEAVVERGSELGLFADEMDPVTGAHLGNFPHALTHEALVQADLALRDTARTQP